LVGENIVTNGCTENQARSHGGVFPPNFVVPRKICFKHIVKPKILPPQKCIVLHQILKPGYGPAENRTNDSCKVFSACRSKSVTCTGFASHVVFLTFTSHPLSLVQVIHTILACMIFGAWESFCTSCHAVTCLLMIRMWRKCWRSNSAIDSHFRRESEKLCPLN